MNFPYDSIEHAERRREIFALDGELELLREERQTLARELKDWGAAVEDLEPEEAEEHVREMRRLVDQLEEWGQSYRAVKAERAEYGP